MCLDWCVRVFDVEVVVVGGDVFGRDFPCFFCFFAFVPPFLFFVKLGKAHWLCFVVCLDAFWELVFVVPDVFGWFTFSEEQHVCGDGGIWGKD